MEGKTIAENHKLADKIELYPETKAFITIKGHKTNFPNNLKCRLINPAKSNLGRVSSQLINQINQTIREKTGLIQWRNTIAVISRFNNFPFTERSRFFTFNIVDFYPSITEKLLEDSITFAKQWLEVNEETTAVIKHCRISLLFNRDGA